MSCSAETGTQTETTAGEAGPGTSPEPADPPLGWSDFPRREVPRSAGAFVSPESELTGLAQRSAEDLRAARGEAEHATEQVREVLFDVAVLLGRLGQLVPDLREPLVAQGRKGLFDQLRILKDQMLQQAADHGIEVRDPIGLPAAEVMDWVNVDAWLHRAEFDAEVVAATRECAIFHEGRPVRFARVDMGAPAEPDEDENHGKDEEHS